MPRFVNKNSHPVRVRADGTLRRVRSGEVVDASGDLADRLGATAGVESASDADAKAWDERVKTVSSEPNEGTESVAGVRDAVRGLRALTSVPLQRVVGDDQAPHGPESGVITTKTAVRQAGDDSDLRAFEEPGIEAALRIPEGSGQEPVRAAAEQLATDTDRAASEATAEREASEKEAGAQSQPKAKRASSRRKK